MYIIVCVCIYMYVYAVLPESNWYSHFEIHVCTLLSVYLSKNNTPHCQSNLLFYPLEDTNVSCFLQNVKFD